MLKLLPLVAIAAALTGCGPSDEQVIANYCKWEATCFPNEEKLDLAKVKELIRSKAILAAVTKQMDEEIAHILREIADQMDGQFSVWKNSPLVEEAKKPFVLPWQEKYQKGPWEKYQ